MSWVWTVMLSFGDEEYWVDEEEEVRDYCQALDNINAWLTADAVKQYGPLTDLTSCATGNEIGMSAHLYGGGFNHLDIEQFSAIVIGQEWHDRDSVQLFIKGEEDQKFTVMEINTSNY